MSEPSRPPVRWLRHVVTVLILGLAVHLLLPQVTTLQHSLEVVRSMKWWVIALAAGSTLLSLLSGGLLLRSIAAETGDRLSPFRGALITLGSNSVGLVAGGIVPAGVAAQRWMRGSGVSAEGALVALWLPALVYNGVLAVVTAFGLLYLLVLHKLTVALAISFGLILLVIGFVVVAIVWGSRRREHFTRLVLRLSERWAALRRRPFTPAPAESSVNRLYGGLDSLAKGGWRGPVLCAGLTTFFDMLALYLVFVASGHRVNPAVLLAAYGLPMLLAKAPFTTPGGIGIVETLMVALFASLSVPRQFAVVAVLAYRLIAFWMPSLAGFALFPYLQYTSRHRQKAPVQTEVPPLRAGPGEPAGCEEVEGA